MLSRIQNRIFTLAAVSAFSLSGQRHLYNDNQPKKIKLETLVWGSNRFKLANTDKDICPVPTSSLWLTNVALRDLVFWTSAAAAVDVRGDVYQWTGQSAPTLTLRDKNIVQVQLSGSTLFALSASGKIYALQANPSKQILSTPKSTWWNLAWLCGNELNVTEIQPNVPFSWREKFVSISSGNDHLLALTSSGRAFAHPITKNANSYGQLALRKCEFSDPSSHRPLSVELIPKAVTDPLANTTAFTRPSSLTEAESELTRFCNTIFEIPSLRDIKFQSLVAGGRSSFGLTTSGKVLGWGANEFGQIGLGNHITLGSILIPTEVNFWRTAPRGTQTRCLDVYAGGDLTGFLVEKSGPTSKTMELLMCGNGQWGGHGNNQFSTARSEPTRAKFVSGLGEYDERSNSMVPIVPYHVSISSSGHVLLTLDTKGNRDLLVWGKNYDCELGNGKKSSVPVPTTLELPDSERLMLKTMKADVKDLKGKTWKNVWVEQRAVTGPGMSCVYWRTCDGI